MTPYTIGGIRYESAASVVNAFAPDGDPCVSIDQVWDLVDSLVDIANADEEMILGAQDHRALSAAFAEYYQVPDVD